MSQELWEGNVGRVAIKQCSFVCLQELQTAGAVVWLPAVGANVVIRDWRPEVAAMFRNNILEGVQPFSTVPDEIFMREMHGASRGGACVKLCNEGAWTTMDLWQATKRSNYTLEVGVVPESDFGIVAQMRGLVAQAAWRLPPLFDVTMGAYITVK